MGNEILIKQLTKQRDAFIEEGETEAANAIEELLKSINKLIAKHDNVDIKIDMKATLRKYDGDIEDGKEPVEIINL